MEPEGTDESWSTPDFLELLLRLHAPDTPQPEDPIARYRAMIAQDARLPATGGLFGAGYARYMADRFPPSPAAAPLPLSSVDGPPDPRVSPDGPAGGGSASSGSVEPPASPAAASSSHESRGLDTAPKPGDEQLAAFKALLADPEVEGCRPDVYLDSRQKPTVGIGHKVTPADNLKVGATISPARIDQLFQQDGARALAAARAQAAEAGISDPGFIAPLASVNFQLGSGWTKIFPAAWKKITAGDYAGAADEIARSSRPGRPSDWMKQTPKRVIAFQKALRALPPKVGGGGG